MSDRFIGHGAHKDGGEGQRLTTLRSVFIIATGVIVGVIGLGIIVSVAAGLFRTVDSRHIAAEPDLSFADKELFSALRSGQFDEVKRVLQLEPNLKAIDPKFGESSLSFVIRRIDDLDLLLSTYSTEEELKEVTDWENFAAVLVKAGVDVNKANNSGDTLLQIASRRRTITFLLNNGANVNGTPLSGPPLGQKYNDFQCDAATLLLSRGADPNLVDSDGKTALHKAAAENQCKMIALLLKSGAEVNKRDSKGYTPLKRAKLSLQKEAAELLEKSGGIE
jgi:hypothetical protein